jgi:Arc/MetJ-type ribon-helix-helix transcriptional regulator
MERVSVEVPAALVGAVRDTVVLLYASTVEALHFALRSHLEGEPRDEAERCRARLAELDGLLAGLGWWGEAASEARAGDVGLTAPRDVLHDALYGSLIEAGERLAAACGEGGRDGTRPDRVRAAAMEVIALDGLLEEVRAPRGA